MARSYAKVYGSIWRDPDWRQLDTPAQRLYLLLLSQPEISNCGVIPYVPIRWARMASDTTLDHVLDVAHELERRRFITVDEETSEVLIRSFVKHDKVAEQPKLVPAARRQFDEIESQIIRTVLSDQYPDLFTLRANETPAHKATDSQPEAYGEGYREAYARARGRHLVDGKRQPSSRGSGEAYTATPDDDPLETALQGIPLKGTALTEARALLESEPDRLAACVAAALHADKPAGYLAELIRNGSWPETPDPRSAADRQADLARTTVHYDHACPHCGVELKTAAKLAEHFAHLHAEIDAAPPPPDLLEHLKAAANSSPPEPDQDDDPGPPVGPSATTPAGSTASPEDSR